MSPVLHAVAIPFAPPAIHLNSELLTARDVTAKPPTRKTLMEIVFRQALVIQDSIIMEVDASRFVEMVYYLFLNATTAIH
jgi:hypothetical protein